jgi:hypothetical protein
MWFGERESVAKTSFRVGETQEFFGIGIRRKQCGGSDKRSKSLIPVGDFLRCEQDHTGIRVVEADFAAGEPAAFGSLAVRMQHRDGGGVSLKQSSDIRRAAREKNFGILNGQILTQLTNGFGMLREYQNEGRFPDTRPTDNFLQTRRATRGGIHQNFSMMAFRSPG